MEEYSIDQIIRSFPNLATDSYFKITSPCNPNYNCIAWAMLYDDRWAEPGGFDFDNYNIPYSKLDGVWYWPKGVKNAYDIDTFIDAFKKKGFAVCENLDLEKDYIKIALYINDKKKCLHAARQKSNGVWMSKLGEQFDIEHGNPYTIQGVAYGRVYCFMKKKYT